MMNPFVIFTVMIDMQPLLVQHIPTAPCRSRGASRLLSVSLFVALLGGTAWGCRQGAPSKPLPAAEKLTAHAQEIDGVKYSFVEGDAYKYDPNARTWSFAAHVYDPDLFAKNYVVKEGKVFRRDPSSGKLYVMSKQFGAGFEEAHSLRDLIGERYGWTSVVLQSPQAPTVADYVQLRTDILNGKSDFRDNRVEPSTEQAHSGKQALRAYSTAPTSSMQCAKALIESEMLHFVKGDDYWFSGWYFLQEGIPYTISDIKSGWLEGTPGLRLVLEDGAPQFELKWANKPRYKQSGPTPVLFPRHQWVHVKIHLKLSDQADGLNELWLDGRQIIHARGQNLPLADTIYNHLEVGITANLKEATVFVDDIKVSDKAF